MPPQTDPYAKIATPDPYAAIAKPVPASAPATKSWWQQGKDAFNAGTQGKQAGDGMLTGALKDLGAGGGDVMRSLAHPFRTLSGMVDDAATLPSVVANGLGMGNAQTQQNEATAKAAPHTSVPRMIGQIGTGAIIGDAVAPLLGKIAPVAAKVTRGAITAGADLDAPILGTDTTPRARYAAAQRTGVNLDLADATNAPVPRGLKAINQDSLFGSHVYEGAKVANKAALTNATDDEITSMSPLERGAGGEQLQAAYQANHQSLLDASNMGHGYIQANYGDTPLGVGNAAKLFGVADDIQKEQAVHAAQFPSLRPGKVDAIVGDASRFGKPAAPFAPATGPDAPSASLPAPYVSPTVTDALKARSGILDVYQNNPELVKSSSDAQLQRMVGGVHDAVMDTLPADAQKTLRDAQLSFKEAKQTYDNPSSPLYNAIRTPNPESLVTGPSSQTPSSLANVLPRVGDAGQGIIQRGVAEKALGESPGGGYNFQTFPRKLSAIPDDYASSLFGNKLSTLQDISDTSQAISKDLNPSGTAKQGQKIAEGVGFLPSFGAPALQYPLARAMNSPGLVNWVMKDVGALPVPSVPTNAALPLTTLPTIMNQQTVSADPSRGILPVSLPVLRRNATQ